MVRKGYKQTEVGIIPQDWEVITLAELLTFQNGINADKSAYGHGIPFINVLEVIIHTHLYFSNIPGRISLPKSVIKSYCVHRGDILFNRTSETQEEVGLASVYLGDEPVVFGGFVIRGRNRGTLIDVIYSGYALRASSIRLQIIARGQGAVRANIGQQDLSKVLAVLPPEHEQKLIAQALSDVDALTAALDKIIAKKRAIKTATMQQLLTGKKRLPKFGEGKGYQQTEIGAIPEDWDAVLLDSVAKRGSGHTPDKEYPKYWNGDIKWISLKDSDRLDALYIYDTADKTTPLGIANSSAVIHPAGTVVLSRDAGVGKSAIIGDEMAVSQHFIAWQCSRVSASQTVLTGGS